jgi:cytochrome P450
MKIDASVKVFILAMARHQDICKRAQAEVDRLSPPDQLPSLVDVESMPYLMAVIKETLRWSPALPIGSADMIFTLSFTDVNLRSAPPH